MKRILALILGMAFLFAIYLFRTKTEAGLAEDVQAQSTKVSALKASGNSPTLIKRQLEKPFPKKALVFSPSALAKKTTDSSEPPLVSYKIEDNMALTQEDIILGEVSKEDQVKHPTGYFPEPDLKIWPSDEIAYYIQPDFPNPERVNEALEMFSRTNIHFIPYTDQADVIVFEKGTGHCKSYLGYVGGHQPIYLTEGCYAKEIAHEILHALGFVHEQNRSDRDGFVTMNWNNIDPEFKFNFEKLSPKMMLVSGLTDFDFESIMIYPDSMFSSNGNPTMKAKDESSAIRPSPSLSQKDVDRLVKAYSN